MSKLCVILNPRAGRGLAARRRGELEQALHAARLDFELLTTSDHGNAAEPARQALERGYRRLVAVGGDGTIHQVAGAMLAERAQRAPAALGIVPLGSGSDLIKSLEGFRSNDIAGSVSRLTAWRTRRIDAGHVHIVGSTQNQSCYFLNNLALGIDAHVAAASQNIPYLTGTAVYLVGALRALMTYRLQPLRMRFHSTELHTSFLLATVANGRCQGGGFWFTPEALLDDGLFDLCLVERLSLGQILRYLPRAMKGTHTSLPRVRMARASQVAIEYSAPSLVIADGEVIARDAQRLTVEVLPQTLEIVV